jgi:hypothetical protein
MPGREVAADVRARRLERGVSRRGAPMGCGDGHGGTLPLQRSNCAAVGLAPAAPDVAQLKPLRRLPLFTPCAQAAGGPLEAELRDYNRRRGLALSDEEPGSGQQQQQQQRGGARRVEAAAVAEAGPPPR